MGLYDREYYRDDDNGGWGEWLHGRAVVWIMVVLGGIYFAQLVFPAGRVTPEEMVRLGVLPIERNRVDALLLVGGMDAEKVMAGQVWRFFTAPFLHDPNNLLYLLLNLLFLYWFGRPLESRLGSPEFTVLFLAAGVASQVGNFAAQQAGLLEPRGVFGSAGALYAVIVVFLFRFPETRLPFVNLPFWPIVAIFLALDAVSLAARGGFVFRTNPAINLTGAAFGLAYHLLHWHLTTWVPGRPGWLTRRASRRPSLRVVPKDDSSEAPTPQPAAAPARSGQAAVDEQLEAKLDNVLEKVARYGKDSLTPDEKNILLRASEIYKRRRGR